MRSIENFCLQWVVASQVVKTHQVSQQLWQFALLWRGGVGLSEGAVDPLSLIVNGSWWTEHNSEGLAGRRNIMCRGTEVWQNTAHWGPEKYSERLASEPGRGAGWINVGFHSTVSIRRSHAICWRSVCCRVFNIWSFVGQICEDIGASVLCSFLQVPLNIF